MPGPAYSAAAIDVVIAGAGLMGYWHAWYAHQAGANIVAIIDPQADAAQKLARRYPAAQVLTGVDDWTGSERVTVAHICTPLASHENLATQLAGKGCHLLVEKPLTSEIDTTAALIDTARTAGVLLCPVHQFAFQRGMTQLREALEHQRLGVVNQLRFLIATAGADGAADSQQDAILTGILPHPLSILTRLWPETILDCSDWQHRRSRPGELRILGTHGATAVSIDLSTHARPTRCEMELTGSLGSAWLNLFHGFASFTDGTVSRQAKITQPFRDAGGRLLAASSNLLRRTVTREPAYPGLRDLIKAFYLAVSGGGPEPVSADQILAEVRARHQLQPSDER